MASVHRPSHLRNGVINKSCPSLFSLCDFLCLIVNFSSSSYFPFSLCQWSADTLVSVKVLGLSFPLEKKQKKQKKNTTVPSAYEGLLIPSTGAGDIMELVNSKSSSFYNFFCVWYILQKPTPGREGPVASLLHCRRATLAFQSIYYGIKWIPLGLIPCCNCNEKKQFLTLHLRSITIKIH